jgi:hypothetical protein
MIQPCSILVVKARPTSTEAMTSQRVCPPSIAFHRAAAASTMSMVRMASGLLNRNISAATGVRASAAAARMAATSPAHRRTTRWRVTTATTPARASGARMAHDENPKIRAEISWTQNAAGGLSTVMNEPGSSEPKKNAFQLTVPDFTAAA